MVMAVTPGAPGLALPALATVGTGAWPTMPQVLQYPSPRIVPPQPAWVQTLPTKLTSTVPAASPPVGVAGGVWACAAGADVVPALPHVLQYPSPKIVPPQPAWVHRAEPAGAAGAMLGVWLGVGEWLAALWAMPQVSQ